MGIKRIIVKSSDGTKYFKWWDTDKELREDRDGTIGKVQSLEDAIALAKVHTGGSGQIIDIKDV